MVWNTKPAGTQQTWLDELGRRLVWYFPAAQVKDILSDYREQFDAGRDHCKTEAEIIQALGTPADAAALLLEEEPSAKSDCLRHNVLWGAVLALCCAFLWMRVNSYPSGLFWAGALISLPLLASVLFLLLRGGTRTELEQQTEKTASPVPVYYIPFAVTLFFECIEQILIALAQAGRLPEYIGGVYTGEANIWLVLTTAAVMTALAALLVYRSITVSIRYFPGIIHTIGAGGSIFLTYALFNDVYFDRALLPLSLLLHLLPYCAGLAAALVFQRWVDGRRPLPRFFRDHEITWQEWHHRLGVRLLGWFSAAQTLEILEDYQEQYELGREQGKSEEDLLFKMGRPEAVVRDLLAEDRKARLNRRKQWPWIVMAAAAVWLLLMLARAFEFGYGGFMWLFNDRACKAGIAALLLGTVSLFVLLRGRNRAAVEQRFPSPQKPTIWLLVLPPVCSALVEGLALECICEAPEQWEPVFLRQTLAWWVITAIEFSALLLTLLLIWTLARCFSGSIRYLPTVPFIAGSFAQTLCAGIYLHGMDLDYIWRDPEGAIYAFLVNIYPWAAGILVAAVSWLILRAAGKKEG